MKCAGFRCKKNDGSPDAPLYAVLFRVVELVCRRRADVKIDDALIRDREEPFLFLTNHESFWDFYYVYRLLRDRRPVFVLNRFYFYNPILNWIGRRTGMIPKRLFTTAFETPIRIMRTLRKGYSVVVFPEGRLSVDGRQNPIVENSASFFRRLGVDIVLGRIRGAYFASPKWRKHSYPAEVRVSAVRVLTPTEIATMTDDELQTLIASTLAFDESAAQRNAYPQKNKAMGLENILYRCADCGALYKTVGTGNELRCLACGRSRTLDEHYRFSGPPLTIPAYYDAIRAMEEAELDRLELRAAVRTKIFGENGGPVRREEGECSLDTESFRYRSANENFEIPVAKLGDHFQDLRA